MRAFLMAQCNFINIQQRTKTDPIFVDDLERVILSISNRELKHRIVNESWVNV